MLHFALIMCGMSKQFVEFIKESRCGRNTKIWAHSTVQCFCSTFIKLLELILGGVWD